MILLPLLASAAIGVANYANISIIALCRKFLGQVTSFTAGVAVTYVFLQLFPEFVERIRVTYHPALFLSVLVGFSSFYLVEKYIYQHSDRNRLLKELAIEDSAVSFVYHFIIGLIMVELFTKSINEGTLFFIPVLLNTAIHTLPVDIARSNMARAVLATATLLGVLTSAYVYTPSPVVSTMLTGFVVGTFIFSVIRHSLPSGREGRPAYFILGMLAYSLVIVTQWSYGGIVLPA